MDGVNGFGTDAWLWFEYVLASHFACPDNGHQRRRSPDRLDRHQLRTTDNVFDQVASQNNQRMHGELAVGLMLKPMGSSPTR